MHFKYSTMNKTIFLSLGLIFLFSCAKKKEGNLTINGKLENADSEMVYLQHLGTKMATLVDSAKVNGDGSFELITNIGDEMSFYRVLLDDSRHSNLVLKANDKVEYSADANTMSNTYNVSGSEQSAFLKEVIDLQYKNFYLQDSLKKEMKVYNQSGDMGGYVQTLQFARMQQQGYVDQLKKFIDKQPASLAALVAAEQMDPNKDFEHMDKALSGIKDLIPNSEYYKSFNSKLEQFRKLAVGAVAPELAFNSPDGELLKLSDYRGKYVLIDFWASWCKPCRAENPNVVKVYDQYKSKGFEIVGVSLDQRKDAWVKAIGADNITWPQMSDLGGWQSMPAKIYNIQSIPATYLLDPDGVIVAKNLRGNSLENKLSEIFADYNG